MNHLNVDSTICFKIPNLVDNNLVARFMKASVSHTGVLDLRLLCNESTLFNKG